VTTYRSKTKLIARAALFHGHGEPLEVREVALDLPGVGEVLVRMAAVGVCGSDLHVIRGEWTRQTPMILGHEGSGLVERVGPGVTNVAPGDRVIIHWALGCGKCAACRRGRPATCSRLRAAIGAGTLIDGTTGISVDGQPVYRMTSVGAFADYVVVPASSLIPLPLAIGLRAGALIGCAALTGVGAVSNVAHVRHGARTLVIGAGGVGQFVVQALRIADAEIIAASDLSPSRREQAVALGATHAVDPRELGRLVQRLGLEGGGFDVVFEAVGSPGTVRAAMDATRIGGMTVLVGMAPTGTEVAFDPFRFTAEEKVLVGSMYGSAAPAVTASEVLGHVEAGNLMLDTMVGPEYDLDHIDQGIATALLGGEGRVLILPGGSVPDDRG